jgi:hypothetical protein
VHLWTCCCTVVRHVLPYVGNIIQQSNPGSSLPCSGSVSGLSGTGRCGAAVVQGGHCHSVPHGHGGHQRMLAPQGHSAHHVPGTCAAQGPLVEESEGLTVSVGGGCSLHWMGGCRSCLCDCALSLWPVKDGYTHLMHGLDCDVQCAGQFTCRYHHVIMLSAAA